MGTRRSPLALWQANWARQQIQRHAPEVQVDLVPMETSGDRVQGPLHEAGGKGLFVKELDAALLADRIDCAVHSLKDVPGLLRSGITIASYSPRADARDLLITRDGATLTSLPAGSRIGTSSPRRMAQLQARRPDLQIVPVRGNVSTRVGRLASGEVDGVVLAVAGVQRLDMPLAHAVPIDVDVCIPAVGQGTMAVTVRADDAAARCLLAEACGDPHNTVVSTAERSLLAAIGGDCHTPLAGYAVLHDGHLRLTAFFAHPDGSRPVVHAMEGVSNDAETLGQTMAAYLQQGVL